jgi:hypothetical protein
MKKDVTFQCMQHGRRWNRKGKGLIIWWKGSGDVPHTGMRGNSKDVMTGIRNGYRLQYGRLESMNSKAVEPRTAHRYEI